mgnify:CR=1 FL=1
MPKVFVVAEAGKNFIDHDWKQGAMTIPYYVERAVALIKVAKKAGADAVKFQTHVFEDEQHFRGRARHDWIKFNESITPRSFWGELKRQCDYYGIEFMTTPMSRLAAIKVNDLVTRWKVGSGNVTDKLLLEYIASTDKPVILSTGMSSLLQIIDAISILKRNELSLLYCKSIYPCSLDKIDFKMISVMKHYFGYPVGFSDHTVEITTPARAVVNGAIIVEKHFTLDKSAFGPDHSFSLEPDELKSSIQLVRDYQYFEGLLIFPDEEELKYWKNFRK